MDLFDPTCGYALHHMRRTFAIVAVLALGVSACGGTDSSKPSGTPQEQITKVVDNLSTAGQRRDADRICKEILAKRLVDELKTAGGDCVTEMDRAIKDATDFDLKISQIKVTGNTATARVRQGEDGRTAVFSFVKEGNTWKASALGGAS
jgi:hypothetical protein